MAKEIYGMDVYWLNFFGLMVLTVIEVAAVGVEPVSYTHLTLPTKA